MTTLRHDCFLSYCHRDRRLAERLVSALSGRGKRVWWDQQLRGTVGPWRATVAQAIYESRAVLVLLSSEAAGSPEVQREMQFAEEWARKPLIPLLVGDPSVNPAGRGALYHIATHQRIELADKEEITDAVVRECMRVLDRLGADREEAEVVAASPEAAHCLGPLAVGPDDLPPLGSERRHVARACHAYFAACVEGRKWADASALLDDMGDHAIDHEMVAVLRAWLSWAEWYEAARERTHSWPELTRDLDTADLPRPTSAAEFARVCRPVAFSLEAGWRQALDRALARFGNHIAFGPRGGSYEHALAPLVLLRPEVVGSLTPVIRGVQVLEASGELDFLDCARELVEALRPTSAEELPRPEQLLRVRTPPSRAQLQKFRAAWDQRRRRSDVIDQFIQRLRPLLSLCAEGTQAARGVPVLLEDIRKVRGSPPSLPLGQHLDQLGGWRDSLEAVARGELDNGLPARDGPSSLAGLEEAGRVFSGARDHAERIRVWLTRREEYHGFRRAAEGGPWPASAEPLSAYAAALRGLLEGVARPWRDELEKPGEEAAAQVVRPWAEKLAHDLQALAGEQQLFEALNHLQGWRPEQALEMLARPGSVVSAPALTESWRGVCKAVACLESRLGEDVATLAAGRVPDETLQRWLEMPPGEFTGLHACAREAAEAATRAREVDPRYGALPLSHLDAVCSALATTAAGRQRWESACGALLRGELAEARGVLELLARDIPAALPSSKLMEEWVRWENAFAPGPLLQEERWEDASRAIGQLSPQLRALAESPPSFGGDLMGRELSKRLRQLDEQAEWCRLAAADEERLRQAGRLIEAEDFTAALEVFGKAQSNWEAVGLWREAAESLAGLRELLSLFTPPAVNAETGLPPKRPLLELGRQRLGEIQATAERAGQLVEKAWSRSRLSFNVSLPERALDLLRAELPRLDTLDAYRRCVDELAGLIADPEPGWAAVGERLRQLVRSQPQPPEGVERLLAAIETGAETQAILQGNLDPIESLGRLAERDLSHPMLALLSGQCQALAEQVGRPLLERYAALVQAAERLCGRGRTVSGRASPLAWLATPLPGDPAGLERLGRVLLTLPDAQPDGELEPACVLLLNRSLAALLEAAGPNRIALLAAAGDVPAVAGELKARREFVPHNLGVAVLAALERGDGGASAELAAALGALALFAWCEPYRRRLADHLGWKLAGDFRRGEAAFQRKVGAELTQLFGRAGLAWGDKSEPASWACRWEVECLAVERLSSRGMAGLPWPFGPALVGFYGLEKELQSALEAGAGTIPLRPCYGPCATAEVLLVRAEDPEGAIRALPELDACTDEAARNAPGYRFAPDPAGVLRADVAAARAEAWFRLMLRYQFQPLTPPEQADALAAELIGCCRELLGLEEVAGLDIGQRLTRSLRRAFEAAHEQLAQPKAARRKRTAEDARARRRYMDALIAFLRAAPRRPWLDECIQILLLRRAELLSDLVDLLFAWWRGNGQPVAALEEMVALGEQAARDAPNSAHTNILRVQMLMLRSCFCPPMDTGELVRQLRDLQRRAAGLRWPTEASVCINELLQLVEGAADFSAWMASLARAGLLERGF